MWKCCRTIWRGNTSHSNYSFVLVFCAIFIFSFAFAIVSDIFITFIFTIQILIVQGDTVHERWAYFHFTHIFIMHASMVCVCFELFFQELKVPRLHELMGANEVNLILLSHKPTLMIIQYLTSLFCLKCLCVSQNMAHPLSFVNPRCSLCYWLLLVTLGIVLMLALPGSTAILSRTLLQTHMSCH